MCSSSRLWWSLGLCFPVNILIPLSFDGPSFDALWACIPPHISLHVHIVPNVLLRSFCDWPRKSLHLPREGQNHPIVRFAYLCHMIGEESVFLSFLYTKLLELGVDIAFYNGSAVTHNKLNLLTELNSHFRAAALSATMILLYCSLASASFTSRNPSSLSVDRLNSKIYTICRALLIGAHPVACPRNDFRKRKLDRGCTVS